MCFHPQVTCAHVLDTPNGASSLTPQLRAEGSLLTPSSSVHTQLLLPPSPLLLLPRSMLHPLFHTGQSTPSSFNRCLHYGIMAEAGDVLHWPTGSPNSTTMRGSDHSVCGLQFWGGESRSGVGRVLAPEASLLACGWPPARVLTGSCLCLSPPPSPHEHSSPISLL